MRQFQYRMEDFLLYDCAAVERHLEQMAAKGWQLESAGRFCWKYRRAEPARLTYAATYAPDASDWDVQPTERQQQLGDYCEAAGWRKVTDWLQMQIFCTAEEDPIPLETDEALRLHVTQEAMWGHFLFARAISLVICLLVAGVLLLNLAAEPVLHLSKGYLLLLDVFALFGVFLYGYHLCSYWWWCRQSERAVAQGGSCAKPLPYLLLNQVSRIGTGVFLVAFVCLYWQSSSHGLALYAALYILLIYVGRAILAKLQKVLKARGLSRGKNMAALVVVAFALAFALAGGLGYGAWQLNWFTPPPVASEALLVTVEELGGPFGSPDWNQKNESSSVLLARSYGRQEGRTLKYELVTVKVPALYDWCLRQYLPQNAQQRGSGHQLLNGDFGQATVYQYYDADQVPENRWLLCADRHILELETNWPLSAEQLRIVAEKLCAVEAEAV